MCDGVLLHLHASKDKACQLLLGNSDYYSLTLSLFGGVLLKLSDIKGTGHDFFCWLGKPINHFQRQGNINIYQNKYDMGDSLCYRPPMTWIVNNILTYLYTNSAQINRLCSKSGLIFDDSSNILSQISPRMLNLGQSGLKNFSFFFTHHLL